MFMYSYCYVLCSVLCILFHCVSLCITCKCVPQYCHRVWTQLQSTNISNIGYNLCQSFSSNVSDQLESLFVLSITVILQLNVWQQFVRFSLWTSFKCILPYILESNPHHFYSFRGLKNQLWIRITCGLDSRSRAGFWKNDRATVHGVRTMQYNTIIYNFIYYL
jgi:hypothetical protein